MALKFGDFFDQFGEGMKSITGYFNRNNQGGGNTNDISLPKETAEILKNSKDALDAWGERLNDLKTQIDSASPEERIRIEEEISRIEERRIDIEKQLTEIEKQYSAQKKDFIEKEVANMTKTKKGYSDLGVASEKFQKDLENLFKQIEEGKVGDDAEKLKQNLKLQENIRQGFGAMMADAEGQFKGIGGAAASQIGGMLSKVLPPQLQLIAELIETVITKAFEQIDKLNKQLISTLRATGGVVNSTMLGFDEMGNSLKGIGSLETQAIAANVSAQEFGQSISNLFKGGFGQIAGMKNVLKDSADEMANYGMEAARMNKLYGTDISGSVRNLMMNFGTGIKDSTDLVKENIGYAKKAGLNVQEVVKNLEAATALAGKFYFESTSQLTQLTFLASKLGISVNSLAGNVIKMNGVVDLFKKQQEMAALELGNVANNLAKVYALRAQGKGGEAEKVMMSSLAKDLMSKGMINKGQVTQQGIATMSAAGIDQEVIQGLSRLAREAESTGISMQKMLNPELMTKAEQRKMEAAERNNRTIEEQIKMTFGGLQQSIIDPFAKLFGPALKSILSGLEPLIGILSTIISTVSMVFEPIITVITTIFDQVGSILRDIFEPVKRMWEAIQNALKPVIDIFSQISKLVVETIFVPFRIIGKVLGFFFDVIAKVVNKISEALKPALDWLSDTFGWLSEGIGEFLDVIDTALGWLLDAVGWLVDGVFKVLGWAIDTFFIKPMKTVWEVLKLIGEFIWDDFVKPIIDKISAIIDFLQPLWDFFADFFADLFEPIIWIWEIIDRIFGKSKKEATRTELTPELVEQMWGQATQENVRNVIKICFILIRVIGEQQIETKVYVVLVELFLRKPVKNIV